MVVTRCTINQKKLLSLFDSLEDEILKEDSPMMELTAIDELLVEVMSCACQEDYEALSYEECLKAFLNMNKGSDDLFLEESETMDTFAQIDSAVKDATTPSALRRRRII